MNPLAITHQFITKKIIVGFLKFLDDHIRLEKLSWDTDAQTYATRKVLQVPIQFGVHDKYYTIVNSSSARKTFPPEDSQAPVEMQRIVPRIGVSLTGILYDTDRHMNKLNRIEAGNDYTIAPVPYNLEMEVSIITKSLDDTLQLMETLIPYFSPTLSLDLNLFGESESVPIGLNTISFDWPTELTETDERFFTTSYYFTIRANYHLQKKTGKRIETVEVNCKDYTNTLWEKYTATAKTPLPSDYPDTPKEDIPVIENIINNLVGNSSDIFVTYDDGNVATYDDDSSITEG